MSAFEDAVIQRIKQLEREVERLQKWERPTGGGGGVTDHGQLTGLADNDHPQYLLTTGKAADSEKLDGVDGTGYVNTSAAQTIAGVKTFSSIPVLPSTNPTLTNHAVRKGYADATYLGISAKAADSDKLDGVDITAFKGLHSLTDPNADRVLFWDDSAGALKWLTLGTGLTITDTTIVTNNEVYFASANDAWNFKPAGTDLFIVDSMSLSNVKVPSGHNLLVEFDAIGYFSDIYGANIYLYNGTTQMITFGAPMRMNIATARAGFHYSYRITSAGTYNLSIRCTASGSTAVDMDFLNRSLKATVI